MKKYIKFLLPSTITLLILCITFYINGLYPFGNSSLVKVDADFQFIPILYRIYDFLHGNAGIIYDDLGLGNNIYISMIIQGSLFSPINLFLYFTNRSNIVNYFNILVIIKFCLITLTTFIYINNKFKISYFYKILCSLLYTFSGFFLLNYFNIMWLDSIILLPLITMYLDKILYKNSKGYGYIITLSLSLIISYYISYFILLFIIFYSFINIFLKIEKKKRKKIIYRLGICTLIATLISSFSFLPCIYQMFISDRFSSISNYPLISDLMMKSMYLLFSPFLLVSSILLIKKYRKNKVEIYSSCLLLLIFSIGLLIEPINLQLHGGSYWDFPFRYGFITTFILMINSLKYLENNDKDNSDSKINLKIIIFFLLGFVIIYLSDIYNSTIIENSIIINFYNIEVYKKIITIIILFILFILISYSIKIKNIRYITMFLTNILCIFIFSSWTMYYEEGYFLSNNANELKNNIELKYDGRYKMDYVTYSPDYGFIFNVNTLDNWIHVLPKGQVNTYNKLGYRTSGTSVNSYGGTVFTDWLFNTKYLISDEEKDKELYELIDYYDEKYLYKYKYNQSNGIIFSNYQDISGNSNFEIQNNIYKNLLNDNKDIIKIDNYSLDGKELYFDYKIQDKGLLYIDTDYFDNINYVEINDKNIYDIDNYIKELGMYEDNITIHISLLEQEKITFSLGFIKLADIMNLQSNVKYIDNKYYINNDKENAYLFLPVNNIDGLKVYLNNELTNTNNYYDNFVSLKLEKGDNYINLEYEMPLLKLGIIVSIIGIILFVIYRIFCNINLNNSILNILYYLYITLVIILFIYYYFYPMIKWLYDS